jgi:hypothetical protein
MASLWSFIAITNTVNKQDPAVLAAMAKTFADGCYY